MQYQEPIFDPLYVNPNYYAEARNYEKIAKVVKKITKHAKNTNPVQYNRTAGFRKVARMLEQDKKDKDKINFGNVSLLLKIKPTARSSKSNGYMDKLNKFTKKAKKAGVFTNTPIEHENKGGIINQAGAAVGNALARAANVANAVINGETPLERRSREAMGQIMLSEDIRQGVTDAYEDQKEDFNDERKKANVRNKKRKDEDVAEEKRKTDAIDAESKREEKDQQDYKLRKDTEAKVGAHKFPGSIAAIKRARAANAPITAAVLKQEAKNIANEIRGQSAQLSQTITNEIRGQSSQLSRNNQFLAQTASEQGRITRKGIRRTIEAVDKGTGEIKTQGTATRQAIVDETDKVARNAENLQRASEIMAGARTRILRRAIDQGTDKVAINAENLQRASEIMAGARARVARRAADKNTRDIVTNAINVQNAADVLQDARTRGIRKTIRDESQNQAAQIGQLTGAVQYGTQMITDSVDAQGQALRRVSLLVTDAVNDASNRSSRENNAVIRSITGAVRDITDNMGRLAADTEGKRLMAENLEKLDEIKQQLITMKSMPSSPKAKKTIDETIAQIDKSGDELGFSPLRGRRRRAPARKPPASITEESESESFYSAEGGDDEKRGIIEDVAEFLGEDDDDKKVYTDKIKNIEDEIKALKTQKQTKQTKERIQELENSLDQEIMALKIIKKNIKSASDDDADVYEFPDAGQSVGNDSIFQFNIRGQGYKIVGNTSKYDNLYKISKDAEGNLRIEDTGQKKIGDLVGPGKKKGIGLVMKDSNNKKYTYVKLKKL